MNLSKTSYGIVLLALGCARGPEQPEEVTGRSAALQSSAVSNAERNTNTTPAKVKQLLETMDTPGAAGEKLHQKQLAELRADPATLDVLTDSYGKLPAKAVNARWKTVVAIAALQTPAAIPFLETVALGPPEIDPKAVEADAGDFSFRIRYSAALGVVRASSQAVEGAKASVAKLLSTADPEIARLVGVELFSAGALSPELKGRLSQRGIYADFRKIEGEELKQLRSLSGDTPHQPPAGQQKPAATPAQQRSMPTIIPTEAASHAN